MLTSLMRVAALIVAMVSDAVVTGQTKVMDLKLERERVFEQGEEPYCKLNCDMELFSAKLDSIALYWVKDTGESIQLARVAESGGTGSFSVEGISGNADLDKIKVDKLDTAICDSSSYFLCEAVAEKPDAEKERAIATSWPGVQQAGQSPRADTVTALERKLADATALLQMFNMSYQNLMANREKEKEQMEQILQKLSGSEDVTGLSGSSKAECNCDDILSKMDDLYTRIAALEDTDKRILEPTSAESPVVPTTSTAPSMECKKGMDAESTDSYVTMNQDTIGKEILCDTQTDGGGWIVIQRRSKGDVDFKKSWDEYREGFGDFTGDFWLGLDAIHKLTSEASYQLRIDMETTESEQLYAQYNIFKVAGEKDIYRLTVIDYEGTSGDVDGSGMAHHNNRAFTTYDSDNDLKLLKNCAKTKGGGWWYKKCGVVNINNVWSDGSGQTKVLYDTGSKNLQLQYVAMKIRRI